MDPVAAEAVACSEALDRRQHLPLESNASLEVAFVGERFEKRPHERADGGVFRRRGHPGPAVDVVLQ